MTGDIINAGHRLNGRLRLHQPLPISLGHFDQVHNRGISVVDLRWTPVLRQPEPCLKV